MLEQVILIDERDQRLGRLMVPPACFIVQHGGAFFVRTQKRIRPIPAISTLATVFDQTEPYVRPKLDTV